MRRKTYHTDPIICRLLTLLLIMSYSTGSRAQTLGGESVFNFLKLPTSPQLTALGGSNVSQMGTDVSLTAANPALLHASMHQQMQVSFHTLFAGLNHLHALAGFRHEKLNTNFHFGLNYLSYGEVIQTDASGNEFGVMRPRDYALQLGFSRAYMDRWQYGATLKFMHSGFGMFRSTGAAADIGVSYRDTSSGWQAGLVLKNMGIQFRPFDGTRPDDLPFDMQLGVSKKLRDAPLQFSATAHHLHRFYLYEDLDQTGGSSQRNQRFSFNNIFSHFVLAAQVFPAEKVEITAAYNHLQRKELSIANAGNGLTGFSLGLGVVFRSFQLRYARGTYQAGLPTSHFGVNLLLNEVMNKQGLFR